MRRFSDEKKEMRKPDVSAQTHSPSACALCYLSSSTLRAGRRDTERNEAAAPRGAETECLVIKGGFGDAPQPSSHLQPPILLFFLFANDLQCGGGERGRGTLVWIWRRGATWAPSIFYLFDSTCDWKSVPSRRRRDIRKARKQILESRTPPPALPTHPQHHHRHHHHHPHHSDHLKYIQLKVKSSECFF